MITWQVFALEPAAAHSAWDVDATTIGVEPINGTVLLRGVAKSPQAKSQAETIARGVDGVKAVINRVDVSS